MTTRAVDGKPTSQADTMRRVGLCAPTDVEHRFSARRCCFESGVSGEVLWRLEAYPKMRDELERLPPKMLSLGSGADYYVMLWPSIWWTVGVAGHALAVFIVEVTRHYDPQINPSK